jgi:hypothetical protein
VLARITALTGNILINTDGNSVQSKNTNYDFLQTSVVGDKKEQTQEEGHHDNRKEILFADCAPIRSHPINVWWSNLGTGKQA